jgi:hypothetical protein
MLKKNDLHLPRHGHTQTGASISKPKNKGICTNAILSMTEEIVRSGSISVILESHERNERCNPPAHQRMLVEAPSA